MLKFTPSHVPLERPFGHSDEAHWISRLAEGWNLIFKQGQLNRLGTVVEVAPGDVAKIGTALSHYGFQGTLYVVEPEPRALKKITSLYRALLREANVIPLPHALEDAVHFLPVKIDALLANHPLDDMIVGEVLQGDQSAQFFEDCYENTPECAALVWRHLEEDLALIQAAKREITSQWKAMIERTQPQIVGISQYRSGFYASHEIHSPDEHAHELLCLLQKEMGETPRFFREQISELGLEGERWWVRFENEASFEPCQFKG